MARHAPHDLETLSWRGPRHLWRQCRVGLALAALGLALLVLRPATEHGAATAALNARATAVGMTPAERTLGGVDLLLVHAELLPRLWLAHLAPGARQAEHVAALRALRAAVRREPVLEALALRFGDALDGPAPNRAALAALERAWNAHLAAMNAPFALSTPLDPALRARGHLALSYYVVARHEASTSAGPASVVYGRRVDRLPVREGYYGWSNPRASEAFVSLDTVEAFARAELWPLIGEVGAARDPSVSATLAAELRGELSALLDEPTYATLRATAFARTEQLEILRRVEACERGAVGLWTDRRVGPGDVRRLQAGLGQSARDCARVGPEEWQRLREATLHIERRPEVDWAVEALTWVTADVVAAHEVQHLEDDAHGLRLDAGSPALDDHSAHEVSAYLGAIVRAEAPHVALLMACRVGQLRADALGAAVSHALVEVDSGLCTTSPPDALVARAAARWESWFE